DINHLILPPEEPATYWCKSNPRKVNILVWRILRDRIPSRWNLSRKDVEVVKAFHGQESGFDSYGCKFKGCGSQIQFLKDIWLDETPLFYRYNRLYRLDINKDCLIKYKIENGNWNWNWSRTNLGSRNLAYFRDMLNEIGDVNIEVAEDTCYWSLGSNGIYTVKEAQKIIDLKTLPSLDLQSTWDKVLPQKVNIFMWRRDFCCSKGNVKDKMLVPEPPKNYARCGHPVDGLYCQGCALLREKLKEDLVTYFQNFQNTFESFDDSTNVVNAPREPFIVKQDHGVNSSQNPPYIDKCCNECGDALDGIFCQRCTCNSCGKVWGPARDFSMSTSDLLRASW
nr:hypothetical protein [Tanacetum cinerariifolium]